MPNANRRRWRSRSWASIPDSGLPEVSLKSGRFGPYLSSSRRSGEGDEKPKRSGSIPAKGIDAATIDLEKALQPSLAAARSRHSSRDRHRRSRPASAAYGPIHPA
ncbi:topoisomerase C-terminal repeat-containing protein [Parvibaculum sp.]|uniref:topoisomerase C-terminal repeat-containing protein n=1 Tax=Parvibaculum sp. TaxID=2024848 RepID=UPI003BAB1CEC